MSTGLVPHRDVSPVRELATLSLIDGALGLASNREFFTRNEASSLLLDVRASVRDVALGAAVTSAVNDALLSYRQDLLLDRWRVVDALLDIRLVLSRELATRHVAAHRSAS